MADLVLLVTPEEVRNKANEINQQKGIMEGKMQDMGAKVDTLQNAWASQAGEKYYTKYQIIRQEIQESLEALMKHTKNLVAAADQYETVENYEVNMLDQLSTDNIF